MTEYFTSCVRADEQVVRALLINDHHTIVETLNSDIVLQTFGNNSIVFTCGVPGTDPKFIIHSRK